MRKIFPGVFRTDGKTLTKNLIPGFKSHSEELIKERKIEYRVWNPKRSKASAALAKGLKTWPLAPGSKILYLGIANGNTSSFFSDIIGPDGIIYGVEISERSMTDLNIVAEKRKNIIPILANAKLPTEYEWVEKVDIVFQDVATSDQSEIIIRNSKKFLKDDGYAMIAIKSRSIDVTKDPSIIYKQELEKLKNYFQIIEKVKLDPYERDHLFVVMKKK